MRTDPWVPAVPVSTSLKVTCATEVFLALALLHREHPEREDFTIQEIVRRAAQENLYGELRSGVSVHASKHCVANEAPNPLAHSMIFKTGKHTRRLLQQGDVIHPGRNEKHWPADHEVPEDYRDIIVWARRRYADLRPVRMNHHPLHALVGLGSHLWKGVNADDYVRQLRDGWE